MPILPLPPVAILKKYSSYSMNHHKYFTKALYKQLFQVHFVKELVVWMVERKKECTTEAYVEQMHLQTFQLTCIRRESPTLWRCHLHNICNFTH